MVMMEPTRNPFRGLSVTFLRSFSSFPPAIFSRDPDRRLIPKRKKAKQLIYEVYCSKEAQAMIKRVLNNEQPSGIYKITRLKTGEIYIDDERKKISGRRGFKK